MEKQKTRPKNNFHCFNGLGRVFWRSIAEGHAPKLEQLRGSEGDHFRNTPQGYRLQMKLDVDGLYLKNGGILSPSETTLEPGREFFRFVGTRRYVTARNNFKPRGGWWIDHIDFEKLVSFAEDGQLTLKQSAAALLCIPEEWQNCAYLLHARLVRQTKAWTGAGLPATANYSPAMHQSQRPNDPVFMGRPDMKIRQIFVPGLPAEIEGAFEMIGEPVPAKSTALQDFREMLFRSRLRMDKIF